MMECVWILFNNYIALKSLMIQFNGIRNNINDIISVFKNLVFDFNSERDSEFSESGRPFHSFMEEGKNEFAQDVHYVSCH